MVTWRKMKKDKLIWYHLVKNILWILLKVYILFWISVKICIMWKISKGRMGRVVSWLCPKFVKWRRKGSIKSRRMINWVIRLILIRILRISICRKFRELKLELKQLNSQSNKYRKISWVHLFHNLDNNSRYNLQPPSPS